MRKSPTSSSSANDTRDDVDDFRDELDRLQAQPSTAELAEHQIPLIANDG